MSNPIPFFNRLARQLDYSLILTLLLCSLALWPLLYRPGLPNGSDVLYHVYRAAEMDRTWANGVLFPRWAEAFYTGYGSPVFHYYAGMTYYLTSLLTRLTGADALNSLRILIALGVLAKGAGMYWFMRGRAGKLAGALSALVYVYSPYILFTEPYARGDYPEFLAFALLPFLFWRFDRLVQTGRARDFLIAALLQAALILTHNLMALVLTGLLGAWLVWGALRSITHKPLFRGYGLAFLALVVGMGLAGFFWLPVLLESSEVHLENLTGVALLDYRNFFIPLADLLEPNPTIDAGAINGLLVNLRLGVATWVLALTGIIGVAFITLRHRILSRQNPQPSDTAQSPPSDSSRIAHYSSLVTFFALFAAAMIFLMLPASAGVWEAIRPLSYLQFPWRFLGPVSFCLAALAGMNAVFLNALAAADDSSPAFNPPADNAKRALHVGKRGKISLVFGDFWTAFIAAILLAVVIHQALPALYVAEWTHETVDTSVAAYQAAEVQGLQRGTTFTNEYLPKTVIYEPGATPRLLEDYADGYPVNKAHLEILPLGVTVEVLEHGPQHDRWRVQAGEPFTLEVLTFYFAGWTAEIAGQPVPITPSDPHGLITLPVPAGEHIVHVYLGSTPPRDVGVLLSVGAVLLLAVIIFWRRSVGAHSRAPLQTAPVMPQNYTVGALCFALLLVLGLLFQLQEGRAWVKSPPGEALLAQHQTDFHLGDSIRLIGYDLNGERFRPGGQLKLRVYWYASAPIEYGYASFVHLSAGGPPLAQADKLNPAGRPTKEWTSEGYIFDDYVIDLPPTLPSGRYDLSIGLYTCDTRPAGECGNGERLPVTDSEGESLGDAVLLAKVEIQ